MLCKQRVVGSTPTISTSSPFRISSEWVFFLLGFSQRHILTAIKLSVSKDKDADGEVSQFGALVTSLAATIGTGNIVGVGTADIIGGVKNIARVCTAHVPFRTII